MADIFLSYARDDVRRAKQIADALSAAGFDVFWDVEIPPGLSWADYLQEKLNACKAALVLWSATSVASEAVREEARIARQLGKFIPVMLDGAPPPFGFGEIQAADLRAWNGETDNPQWRLLLEGIGRAVGKAAAAPIAPPLQAASEGAGWRMPDRSTPSAPPRSAIPAPAPKKPLPWKWIAGGVGAVVALLIAVSALDGPSRQSAPPLGISDGPSPDALPAAVRAIVEEAREAQEAGRAAANAGTEAAKAAGGVMMRMQQGAPGYESGNINPFTTVAGDFAALRRGDAGLVNMQNSQDNTRFSGSMQLDMSSGFIRAMTGVVDNGRGGTGVGHTDFDGPNASGAGRDSTPVYTSEGRARGVAGSFESEGIGVVNFKDGRRYEGQYRMRGADLVLLRHGMGVTYAVDGEVIEAGRYANDKYVGP